MKVSGKPTNQTKTAARSYTQHGLTTLIHNVRRQGLGAVDQRSSLAIAAKKLRSQLATDLGGENALSVQQCKLIDEFIKRFVMIESIDSWLFAQPYLVNKRTKALYPVMMQRMQIADGMIRCLKELGLKRQAKAIPDLQDYLKQQASEEEEAPVEPDPDGEAA